MYFVSDMPGGYGETDIWKSTLENGVWGNPVNLGGTVNTEGKEMFPTIKSDGNLYYSSDGKLGLGGLDLFVAFASNEGFDEAINLGYPLNTRFDDFSMAFLEETNTGYFSSNRNGGKGKDDIYKVKILKEIMPAEEPLFSIKGKVINELTNSEMSDVTIVVENNDTGEKTELLANHSGYDIELDKGSDYTFYYQKEGYVLKKKNFTSEDIEKGKEVFSVEMEFAGIELENIYFLYSDFSLTSEATSELDELSALLKQHQDIHIEINAHTDARGEEEFNIDLSEKRAKSAYNYIVSQGIDGDRLSYKGYGESKPVNHCIKKTGCTEEEYATNRRIEFEVHKSVLVLAE